MPASKKPVENGPDASDCKAFGNILDRVGDKWTVLVVGVLSNGPMRFNALQRALPGITQRMLTLQLRALEHDGIVRRTVTPTVPPQVEYALTEQGRSLGPVFDALGAWGNRRLAAGSALDG